MSVPELWLQYCYPVSHLSNKPHTPEQVWQTALDVLGRYGFIDGEHRPAEGRWRLELAWPELGDYGWFDVCCRPGEGDAVELQFRWPGKLIYEVTETFCEDVACLAKQTAVESPPAFAFAGWEGWYFGEDRPNAWEALQNNPELKAIPKLEGGRHWFYILGPERHRAIRPYLDQLGAQRIEPLPGGSVFLFLEYPWPFDEQRCFWTADMEFDPDYNPVARRNLEQPYQRRVFSSLPGCQPPE